MCEGMLISILQSVRPRSMSIVLSAVLVFFDKLAVVIVVENTKLFCPSLTFVFPQQMVKNNPKF